MSAGAGDVIPKRITITRTCLVRPHGFKGEEIPLSARIFAVIDVWDALVSDRPYREAWHAQDAVRYIAENSGKQFDPQVVQVFLANIEQLQKYYELPGMKEAQAKHS